MKMFVPNNVAFLCRYYNVHVYSRFLVIYFNTYAYATSNDYYIG